MLGHLTIPQIEEVLKNNALGRLGFYDGSKPYIIPINYAYDGNYIIGHSREGMKIQIMRNNPSVCFEVDQMKSFRDWKSVIVWGQFQEITRDQDKNAAMELFVDRMVHLKLSETSLPHNMTSSEKLHFSKTNVKTIIYRIAIQEKSGRFEDEA